MSGFRKSGFLPAASNLFFVAALFYCHFSGNDKAPFVMISSIFLTLIFSAFLATNRLWMATFLAGVPAIYFALVVLLTRAGWIDSKVFLGFR